MDCDRNMVVINQKSPCEVPEDWVNVVRNARVKPSPFQVISVDCTFFRVWNSFLEPHYIKKNPIVTRPLRVLLFQSEYSRLVEHSSSFNGHWESTPIRPQQSSAPLFCPDWNRKEFFLPNPLREDAKTISEEKFKDFQHLNSFAVQLQKVTSISYLIHRKLMNSRLQLQKRNLKLPKEYLKLPKENVKLPKENLKLQKQNLKLQN
ncbi:hypothetical protein JTB14_010420 [Gonioctena quinquepunctata]|nr:hypothetical protein JTB14_010420 [Gonioctena quinquepunctata]